MSANAFGATLAAIRRSRRLSQANLARDAQVDHSTIMRELSTCGLSPEVAS